MLEATRQHPLQAQHVCFLKLNMSAFLQGVSPAGPQLLREGRGSALIRSNDSLCFPRGHAVDHWEGHLHLASASVPAHGRACAPGWQGSGVLYGLWSCLSCTPCPRACPVSSLLWCLLYNGSCCARCILVAEGAWQRMWESWCTAVFGAQLSLVHSYLWCTAIFHVNITHLSCQHHSLSLLRAQQACPAVGAPDTHTRTSCGRSKHARLLLPALPSQLARL
jgi:hypothetical protein